MAGGHMLLLTGRGDALPDLAWEEHDTVRSQHIAATAEA